TASRSPCSQRRRSWEKTSIRYFVSSPPRPASRRGGIFINICSTGRDSPLPHSKAPSSLRIQGLLHRSRNCSWLRRDQRRPLVGGLSRQDVPAEKILFLLPCCRLGTCLCLRPPEFAELGGRVSSAAFSGERIWLN